MWIELERKLHSTKKELHESRIDKVSQEAILDESLLEKMVFEESIAGKSGVVWSMYYSYDYRFLRDLINLNS
jgi:hypothetical protein